MMLKTYSQEQSRGSCWRQLLADRPVFENNGHSFQPKQHHFRKHHTEEAWGWYVEKWQYLGTEILDHPPCDAPPNLVLDEQQNYPYVWATWTDHDGRPGCGFVLGLFLLEERALELLDGGAS